MGKQSDPFLRRKLSHSQAAREAVERTPVVSRTALCPKIHRIGFEVETNGSETADCAWHVPSRGNQEPTLARLGRDEVAREQGVLVRVARPIFQHDALGGDVEELE